MRGKSIEHRLPNRQLTLGYLGGERGGDGDEVEVLAAVVDRHLAPLPQVICVGVALGHEGVQGEATVHQHAYRTTDPTTRQQLTITTTEQNMHTGCHKIITIYTIEQNMYTGRHMIITINTIEQHMYTGRQMVFTINTTEQHSYTGRHNL